MEINEFKDRLFDILNETDNIPIQDLVADDKNNSISVYLTDNTRFIIQVEKVEFVESIRYNMNYIYK